MYVHDLDGTNKQTNKQTKNMMTCRVAAQLKTLEVSGRHPCPLSHPNPDADLFSPEFAVANSSSFYFSFLCSASFSRLSNNLKLILCCTINCKFPPYLRPTAHVCLFDRIARIMADCLVCCFQNSRATDHEWGGVAGFY